MFTNFFLTAWEIFLFLVKTSFARLALLLVFGLGMGSVSSLSFSAIINGRLNSIVLRITACLALTCSSEVLVTDYGPV